MKLFLHLVVAAALGFGALLPAAAQPVINKDYKTLSPAQPTDTPGKVEVLEFFQYGCGHCYDLEPVIAAWKAKKPKDVEFRYVPTVWDESRVPQAKIFYTLEAMGLLDKFHDKVYDGIHRAQLKLWEKPVLMKWIAQQSGVDAKKFDETYESFGVMNKVQRAAQLTKAFRITGTPTIIVNGKYITGPSYAMEDNGVNYPRMTAVMDDLINMERKKK